MKKAFDEFRHLYRITDDFKIENIGTGSGRTKGRRVKIWIRNNKYPTVELSDSGYSRKIFVHRIIAEEFVPNPHNLPFVNHIDGNKLNFHPSNLEWVTGSQNAVHAYKTGLWEAPNKKQVVDLGMGIFYDSLSDACKAKMLNPVRVATKIWRGKNNTGLVYV